MGHLRTFKPAVCTGILDTQETILLTEICAQSRHPSWCARTHPRCSNNDIAHCKWVM